MSRVGGLLRALRARAAKFRRHRPETVVAPHVDLTAIRAALVDAHVAATVVMGATATLSWPPAPSYMKELCAYATGVVEQLEWLADAALDWPDDYPGSRPISTPDELRAGHERSVSALNSWLADLPGWEPEPTLGEISERLHRLLLAIHESGADLEGGAE